MPYTLAKWALWLIAAAAIGLVVGWLLGRLSAGRTRYDHDDDHADAAAPAGRASGAATSDPFARAGSSAAGGSGEPSAAARTADLDRMRAKLAELESVAIERDRLAWELSELRTQVHAAAAPTADAVFGPIGDGNADAVTALTAERDEWAAKAIAFEQMVSELRVRVWNAEAKVTEAQQRIAALQAQPAPAAPSGLLGARPLSATAPARPAPPPRPDVAAGEAALGVPLRFDDLTVIEGIGPQIAQLCAARGIDSWWAMANTDVDRLRRMLQSAGPRFQVHDPASWPEQARLLSIGDWAGFMRLCHALRGGRSVE